MKILLLSDMHFKTTDSDEKINTAKEIAKITVDQLETDEKLLVLNLGDIVDKGIKDAYSKAKEFYDLLKAELPDNTGYAFVPGNHDYCGDEALLPYDNFINNYSTIYCNYDYKSTFLLKYDEISFILSKSTLDRYNDNEIINIDKDGILDVIKENGIDKNSVLVMHHGILSKKDNKFIKGQDEIIDLNDKYSFQCFIHGHEHCEEKDILKKPLGITAVSAGNCFNLPKATTPQFSILDVKCGIITDRLLFEKKHKIYELTKKENIQSINYTKKYETDDDYICRKVVQKQNYENNFYFHNQSENAENIIKQNKISIILGEAGSGKSYFAKNFTANHQKANDSIQLYFCKSYSGEKILELISPEFQINVENHTLIFDGLDELNPDYVEKFITEINNFCKQNKTKIILTSRLNEFKKLFKTQDYFNNLPQYVLIDFDDEDLRKYLQSQSINLDEFLNESSKKSLNAFLHKPFYLYHFSNYFKNYGYLPKQNEFFPEIINKEIEKIKIRLESKNIILGKDEIKKSFFAVGFTFLCLNQNYISVNDTKNILNTLNLPMIENNSIINVTEQEVFFCHNNFKEYCASQFLLEFDFNEIIKIITINNKIKYTWLNTLGFYISSKIRNKYIINYLLKNDLIAITNIETDKIDPTTKIEIYNNILSESISSRIRIEHLVHDIKIFGMLVNSENDIENLLSYIDNEENSVAIIDSFVLLSQKENLFNKNDKIYDKTISFLEKHSTCETFKDYVLSEGIDMLSDLHLCDDEEKISKLLKIFNASQSDNIHHSIYRLLTYVDSPDKYISEVLKLEINKKPSNNQLFDSNYYLYQYLIKLNSIDSIISLLSIYNCKEIKLYNKEKLLINYLGILKNHKEWINKSKNVLFEIYFDVHFLHNSKERSELEAYFKETGLADEVIDFALSDENSVPLFTLYNLFDDNTEKYLCQKYENDELKNKYDFINYVKGMDIKSKNYKDFVEIINKKGDSKELQYTYNNFDNLRKEAEQKHFDLMFCFEEYINTFNSLFQKFIIENWTVKKFFDEYIMHTDWDEDLNENYYLREQFYHDISRFLSDNDLLSKYSKVVSVDDLRYLKKITDIANNKNITVTPVQINYFRKYCDHYISNELSNDISKQNLFPNRMALFAKISYRYNFTYDIEYLEQLLLIPSFIFSNNEPNRQLSSYILKNYRDEDIEKSINKLITQNTISDEILCQFLNYQIDKKSNNGLEKANVLLTNKNANNIDRDVALNYLLAINGNEDFINDLDISNDKDLLEILFNRTEECHQNIIEGYKIINTNDPDHLTGISELIQLQDHQGITSYINYCKTNLKTPDFNNTYPKITEKIAHLDKAKFIDDLCELLLLKYREGVKDSEYFGIYYGVSKAFINISKNHYENVINALDTLISENSENKELIQNCNYIKLDINNELKISTENNMGLDELFALLMQQ